MANRSGIKDRARAKKVGKNPNFGLNPSTRTDRELVQVSANKWKYKRK